MKISDPLHALILFDQKILKPRKSRLKSSNGDTFLFIRMDTQLNWPRIIVEDKLRKEFIWNSLELKKLELEILESSQTVEYLDFN